MKRLHALLSSTDVFEKSCINESELETLRDFAAENGVYAVRRLSASQLLNAVRTRRMIRVAAPSLPSGIKINLLPCTALEIVAEHVLACEKTRPAVIRCAVTYACLCRSFAPFFLKAGRARYSALPSVFYGMTSSQLGVDTRHCRLPTWVEEVVDKSSMPLLSNISEVLRTIEDLCDEETRLLEWNAWNHPCLTIDYAVSEGELDRFSPVTYTEDKGFFTLRDILQRVEDYYSSTFTACEANEMLERTKLAASSYPGTEVEKFFDDNFASFTRSPIWKAYRRLVEGTLPRWAGVERLFFEGFCRRVDGKGSVSLEILVGS